MIEGDVSLIYRSLENKKKAALRKLQIQFENELHEYRKAEKKKFLARKKYLLNFYKKKTQALRQYLLAEQQFKLAYHRYNTLLEAFELSWKSFEKAVQKNPGKYVSWTVSQVSENLPKISKVFSSVEFLQMLKKRGIKAQKLSGKGKLKFYSDGVYMDFSFDVVKQWIRHTLLNEVATRWLK